MLLLILFLFLMATTCENVFRGGTISAHVYKYNETQVTIEYKMRFHWSLTYSNRAFCLPSTFSTCDAGGLIQSFQYQYPCPSRSPNCTTSVTYCSTNCTNNFVDNHNTGLKIFHKTFIGSSLGLVSSMFSSGRSSDVTWIVTMNENGLGGVWRQRLRYDTSILSSKYSTTESSDHINHTPQAHMPNVIRVRAGVAVRVPIGYADSDDDYIRCRWSRNASDECGGVCNEFKNPNSPPLITFLDTTSSCVLNLETRDALGLMPIALQIEDFDSLISTNPLSSIPLQFLIEFIQIQSSNCTSKPLFRNLFELCQLTPANHIWSQLVQVVSTCETMIDRLVVLGLEEARVTRVSEDTFNVSSFVSVQKDTLYASNRVCFLAYDVELNSNFQCLTLHIGHTQPRVLKNQSFAPSTNLNSTLYTWIFTFDQPIELRTTSTNASIKFFTFDNRLVLSTSDVTIINNKRDLRLLTNISFNVSKYYVLFDEGIVYGQWNCRLPSIEISDRTYWTFIINKREDEYHRDESKIQQVGVIVASVIGAFLFIVLILVGICIIYVKTCRKRLLKIN